MSRKQNRHAPLNKEQRRAKYDASQRRVRESTRVRDLGGRSMRIVDAGVTR